jgi:antitoxin (DNA-binding transcriptional repressor) of toxin-antitoxin stability system
VEICASSYRVADRELIMASVNLSEAKAHQGALNDKVGAGEPGKTVRRGELVAQAIAIESARKPINQNALNAVTSNMPEQPKDAGRFVRMMRDAERY